MNPRPWAVARRLGTALCPFACLLLAAGLRAAPGGPAVDVEPGVSPILMSNAWPASWIAQPGPAVGEFGVLRLRKTVDLPVVPPHFVIHVSGDRRYRLYVNGASVCCGPQRSDRMRWRFESVDIAPFLVAGKNTLAAAVWNYGDDPPYALFSVKTAFILQGDTGIERVVDSDSTWRVMRDGSVTAEPLDRAAMHTYIVVGPGDHIDGRTFPWGWTATGFDDSAWAPAAVLGNGMPAGLGTDVTWWLAPRNIPLMAEVPQRLGEVRRATGVPVDAGFLAGRAPVTISAHSDATLLIDQGFETNAYPHVVTRAGRDATVVATYAEALVDATGQKGDRNAIADRHIVGKSDRFIADGGEHRDFTTLTFRTYRYLQLSIHTADQPLTLLDVYGVATGYPLRETATFTSDDPALARIWQVGWRTARLCAYETYMDCPYYEQMQYVGDTRIQSLITLYVSGDDRLMRNAIELFDRSRLAEGLTLSRYPAVAPQIIPTFSLFWIQMVHDYYRLRRDDPFIRDRLLGIQNVLAWFEPRVDSATGLLGPVPYWCFVDWPDAWGWIDDAHPGGQPPGAHEGGSAILSLQLAWTLADAADLFAAYGQTELAQRYSALAERLRHATVERCWDPARRLIADTPARTSFSQHANALAVLSGAITGPAATDLMRRVVDDPSLTPCTLYFRFYLLRALKQAGLGDAYARELGPWRTMLDRGLTTFAERPDPTRSDCHAWSASPNYELLATVCGIEPASPGFATVRIEPHLGDLTHVSATMPHPNGKISVHLERTGDRLAADITLPRRVTGTFVWHGVSVPLHHGLQHLDFDR